MIDRIVSGLLFLTILSAQPANDQPIRSAFKQADRTLTQTSILRRTEVAANLDLVIAIASPRPLSNWITWWGEKDKLGLFLQQQSNPNSVYTLALTPGSADCSVRIVRATATDTVVQCTGEKSSPGPNRKFDYDLRAKALISQFSYQPFSMRRIVGTPGNGALIIGTDGTRQVAVSFPDFRLFKHSEELNSLREFKPINFGGGFRLIQESRNSLGPQPLIREANGKSYPLPRSTYEGFAQLRPGQVRNGNSPPIEYDDHVGPHALEGNNLWFGKSFYEGEGTTGIGGFGYFDSTEKRYHLYAPPEIADYSVSAIHVEANAVWMALIHNGEYGGSSGGLLRFDRNSNAIRKFELPGIGLQFLRAGDKLLLATNSGIAVIVKDQITRYFVDKTTDGRLRLAEE